MSQVILPAVAYELPAESIELPIKLVANMEQPPKVPSKTPLNPTVEDEQARESLSVTSNTGPAVTDKPPPLPGNRPATNNESSSNQPAPSLAPELPPRQVPDTTTQNTTSNAPDLPPRNTVPNRWSRGPFLRTPQSDNKPNEFLYTRDSHKMIVYFVPFPKPIDAPDDMPQRFLIYTPPPPHLLKPAEGVKEGKRHKAKRFWQQEIKKAKTYEGKTMTLKGLHSKTMRGIVWATAAIKPTDITFLNRVPRKASSTSSLTLPLAHQFTQQILLTHRRALTHTLISSALLAPTLIIDTFAAVIWPFGGLFEIDLIWFYASIRGYLVSRSLVQRLSPSHFPHPSSTSSKKKKFKTRSTPSSKKELHLRFEEMEKMKVLERYLAELCHKHDPARFASPGVPPTNGEVLRAMGWESVQRGRGWDDARWQEREVQDDLEGVMKKGAKSWGKWCRLFEKKPEKALKR
ncbi:secreted protein [Rutstroemia sp. NJR-2017a BBW]|nr:secreted protein [Rutstroemia sp. NJR-2017a BBW]